jgi:hypothetical protein
VLKNHIKSLANADNMSSDISSIPSFIPLERGQQKLPTMRGKTAAQIDTMISMSIYVGVRHFSLVESPKIKALVEVFNPDYQLLSQNTLSNLILQNCYAQLHQEVMCHL